MNQTCMFNRNFDVELARELEAEKIQGPRVYSKAELDAAAQAARKDGREAGLAEGHALGLAEARAETAEATRQSLDHLAPQLDAFVEATTTHHRALEDQIVSYVLKVSEKLFPEFLERHGPIRAHAEIRALVERVQTRGALRIVVTPDTAGHITSELPTLLGAQSDRCAVEVVADEASRPGEARLQWDNGFCAFSYDAMCRTILAELTRVQAALQDKPPP